MEQVTLQKYARKLRKNSPHAERHLWYHLRANRLGFKFRRQTPIGTYLADFVCMEKRLIVELGGQHMDNQLYDAERTKWLSMRGFRVLRFWNDVLKQTGAVFEVILSNLRHQQPPSPQLSLAKNITTITQTSCAGEGWEEGYSKIYSSSPLLQPNPLILNNNQALLIQLPDSTLKPFLTFPKYPHNSICRTLIMQGKKAALFL